MRWTFVDSCGLDVVPKPPANGRVSLTFNKLQSGSYGLTQPPPSQAIHHPHNSVSRSEAVRPPPCPLRAHLPAANTRQRAYFGPAMAQDAAESIISEDQ